MLGVDVSRIVIHQATPEKRFRKKLKRMFGHRQVRRNYLKCLQAWQDSL